MIDPDKLLRTLEIPQLFSEIDSGPPVDRNSIMSSKFDDDKIYEMSFFKKIRVDSSTMYFDRNHQGPH